VLIYHNSCGKSKIISNQKREGITMAKENEALVVVEEGTDVEVQIEGLGCCYTVFAYYH
jgi:hypothetical protein